MCVWRRTGNRDMISRLELLPPLFRLFGVCDKPLRKLLFSHIVNDIKRLARGSGGSGKHTHINRQKLMQSLQHFMYTMLKDDNVVAAKKSLDVMIELWRRRIWNDDKTVNAIAGACFSKESKIMVTALRFFLGTAPPSSVPPFFSPSPSLLCVLCHCKHRFVCKSK